ncbi:MAG: phosphodiester glycosidase family protein, partial [Lacibacter sp.]
MKQKKILLIISAGIILLAFSSQKQKDAVDDDRFLVYKVNTKTQDIRFYLKDENNVTFGSIENLKNWLAKRKKKLVFAMNAGMYKQDQLPLGLYIENQKVIAPINKSAGSGNFYLQPNGVFYIGTNNSAQISKTKNFPGNKGVKFATQSGPM